MPEKLFIPKSVYDKIIEDNGSIENAKGKSFHFQGDLYKLDEYLGLSSGFVLDSSGNRKHIVNVTWVNENPEGGGKRKRRKSKRRKSKSKQSRKSKRKQSKKSRKRSKTRRRR